MRHSKLLLILLIVLCLAISSGCAKSVPVYIELGTKYCPTPTNPYSLISLDYDYLESINGNAVKMLQNRIIIDEYINDLYQTIRCYENQVIKDKANGTDK